MFNNPTAKKFTQITEESQAPFHAPFMYGNDYYVLTQQDTRKIEDTRLLGIVKLNPNGDMNPVDPMAVDFLLYLLKTGKVNLIFTNSFQCRNEGSVFPQPMDVTASSKSSIDQQIKWDKCINTSAAFPMHYSRATSTTDLCLGLTVSSLPNKPNSSTRNCVCCSPNIEKPITPKRVALPCGSITKSTTTSTCPGAREQRKQKKMKYSYLY